MKQFNLKMAAFCFCIFVGLLFTNQTNAQAIENPNFEAGLAAYENNNLPLAFKEFLAAAKANHSDSQYNVGLMYEQGIGTSVNLKEALFWYEKAAKQGNTAAQYNLGVLYENGKGTEVNFAKANEWYRKASQQGDGLAIGNLGMLYIRGDGVKENKVAGLALLLVSATVDNSSDNLSKQNISSMRGLTSEMFTEAQMLSDQMMNSKNMLVPLDAYLSTHG
jgi:TPR repeat protein